MADNKRFENNYKSFAEQGKLQIDSSYEELERIIPEFKAIKGVDQKSDFHDLTLDNHTKKVSSLLEQDVYIATLDSQIRNLVLLAAKMHDLGKNTKEGQQIHPRDPEKKQYINHDKASEKITRELLEKYFKLPKEQVEFVALIVSLHMVALNVIKNFGLNNQPKGRELASYDKFFYKVDEISSSLNLEDKIKILLTFTKADKLSAISDTSDIRSEKVASIKKKLQEFLVAFEKIELALPALVEAVMEKRSGNQNARVCLENDKYLSK